MVRKASTPKSKPKQKYDHLPKKKVYYTEEEVAKALRECRGKMYLAAAKLDIHPDTIRSYFRKWPGLRKVRKEAKEQVIDKIENKVIDEALKGSFKHAKYYLDHHAQHRGWGPLAKVNKEETNVTINAPPLVAEDLRRQLLDKARADCGLPPLDRGVPLEIGLKELPESKPKGVGKGAGEGAGKGVGRKKVTSRVIEGKVIEETPPPKVIEESQPEEQPES